MELETRPRTEHEDRDASTSGSATVHPRLARPGPLGSSTQSHILGCSCEDVVELFAADRTLRFGRQTDLGGYAAGDAICTIPDSYWITSAEDAEIESPPRHETRLLDRGRLQHVRHISRVRLMGRGHIVALA
jgi:hypothetical protein